MTTEATPGNVPLSDQLCLANEVQPLVERLRTDVLWHQRRGNETIARDCQEAADMIEAARAVGIKQEQIIMDAERTIQSLRAALSLAEPALELGCDALRNEAEDYHAAMKGYKPERHKMMDLDYERAEMAWKAVVAVLKA